MSTSAVVMMIVAMLVVWGGLALAIYRLNRSTIGEPGGADQDV
jgi:hypothetical protein